jgi:cation:H+ antiporter
MEYNQLMVLPIIAVSAGLALLVWSADRFVEGSAAAARHFGIPSLVIGMVIVGFGTSAPELLVSTISALQGNPGIALGNAYGSNISNIALILGITALISPITVHSSVLRKELPILTLVTALAAFQIRDGSLARVDAWILLGLFSALMVWTFWEALRRKSDPLGGEFKQRLEEHSKPLNKAVIQLLYGLILLIISSRILVWGAVEIAGAFGVSDLVIGLTIVALGTSLPELASSISAARKGEHDIALGNILGSNLFNTLAVVGLAGVIHPMKTSPAIFYRDMPVMGGLTLSLFAIGYGFRGPGRVNRFEGAGLLAVYAGYIGLLLYSVFY